MKFLEKHYQRWCDGDLVNRFASKSADDFFRTETYFLECYGRELTSVLDIGCASGRMIELVRRYAYGFSYTGVDMVPENIELARRQYPESVFQLGNALDFRPGRCFDLVNATGVCQHEPRFEALIRHMCDLSSRYVMFDVKLAAVAEHVVDMDRSYCSFGEKRLYYVLLSWPRFRAFLTGLPGVAMIEIFGYSTPPSRNAHMPDGVDRIASVGVCVTVGDGSAPRLRVELPEWLANCDEQGRTGLGLSSYDIQ